MKRPLVWRTDEKHDPDWVPFSGEPVWWTILDEMPEDGITRSFIWIKHSGEVNQELIDAITTAINQTGK